MTSSFYQRDKEESWGVGGGMTTRLSALPNCNKPPLAANQMTASKNNVILKSCMSKTNKPKKEM